MECVKKRGFFFGDKCGESLLYPIVINILVFLLFFSMFFAFVHRASSGDLLYERTYSKQIALLIDGAEPGMNITLDFGKAIEIAKANGVSPENVVRLIENEVIVGLSEKGGYGFKHFSDSSVDFRIDENNLVVTVSEKLNALGEGR